jgi:hypothetical protein
LYNNHISESENTYLKIITSKGCRESMNCYPNVSVVASPFWTWPHSSAPSSSSYRLRLGVGPPLLQLLYLSEYLRPQTLPPLFQFSACLSSVVDSLTKTSPQELFLYSLARFVSVMGSVNLDLISLRLYKI